MVHFGRAFWCILFFHRLSRQVMGAISWMVDSLLYDEAIAMAEEEQREREREATQEEREQDKEDGLDDQVQAGRPVGWSLVYSQWSVRAICSTCSLPLCSLPLYSTSLWLCWHRGANLVADKIAAVVSICRCGLSLSFLLLVAFGSRCSGDLAFIVGVGRTAKQLVMRAR